MRIHKSPQRANRAPLTLDRSDPYLIINGVGFDFASQMDDGDRLPASAVNCDALLSDVTYTGAHGVEMTLIAPHGKNPGNGDKNPGTLMDLVNNPDAEFEIGTIDWSQKRSAAQQADETLADQRAGAAVSREGFLQNAIAAGVLSMDDAVDAAKGNWPVSMASFFVGLTPAEIASIRIRWASTSVIRRTDPLFVGLADHLGLTEPQRDALIGIAS